MKFAKRMRVGRHAISVPDVPSMAEPEREPDRPAPRDRTPIDRKKVQYLDRVRAVFRPARLDALAPRLERFVGQEDIFRHVGASPDGTQIMMQCPSYWPDSARWVPIGDLEILEILEDQDVRAG